MAKYVIKMQRKDDLFFAWNVAFGFTTLDMATLYTQADYEREKDRPLPLKGFWFKLDEHESAQ